MVVADVGTNLIQVPATCTEAGTTGNGYLPGTISSPVDVLPYVLAVKNITQTTGGTDAEEDDSFRTRIQQSSERLSPGTGPAYIFYARSAYAGIIDVAVYSSRPGVVTIVPLLSGGEVPGQEILDLVSEYCSDDKRRALCDTIEVIPPVIVEYEINVDYWILRNSSALADSVESAILEACNEFASKLKERLGLPVVPETLGATLNKITGVARAVVVQPTYTELNVNQVAISTGSTVNCQGEM